MGKRFSGRRHLSVISVIIVCVSALGGLGIVTHIAHADITSNLLAYWKFDDGSGTIAADSSGNGYTGTLYNNPTWTTGEINGALSFNGANQYVQTGNNLTIGGTNFTVSAWIKGTNTVISQRASGAGTAQWIVDIGNTVSFYSDKNPWLSGTIHLVSGQWNQVVVVGTATSTQIYVNDVLDVTGPPAFDASSHQTPTNNVVIGYSSGTGTYFSGAIDDVRIYNRTLFATDIAQLYSYNGGSVVPPSAPVNLAATGVTSSTVSLSWSASVAGTYPIAGYKIYRGGLQVGTTSATSYTDSGLQASTTYSYGVAAYDSQGDISNESNVVTVTTLQADGGGGSNIVTAASCNQSDVQAALSVVSPGGTVVIPAGTCTWNVAVTVGTSTWQGSNQIFTGQSVTLQGAGIDQTTIIDNTDKTGQNPSVIPNALWIATDASHSVRLTQMTFTGSATPDPNNKAMVSVNGSGIIWRIDHVHFIPDRDAAIAVNNTVPGGLIDHNSFNPTGWYVSLYVFNGGSPFGDQSWTQPANFGSSNFTFIEDNTFSASSSVFGIDGWSGERVVIRHNTFINMNYGDHGTETPGRLRGARALEIYDNNTTFNVQPVGRLVDIRSGTSLIYNNTFTLNGPSWWATNIGSYQNYRDFGVDMREYFGQCDGTAGFDMNDGVTYDAGTASAASVISGNTSVTTFSGKNWTSNQWVGYSIFDTATAGQYPPDGVSSIILSNTTNTITAYYDTTHGPGLTFNAGDGFQILRATTCLDQVGRGAGNLISGWPATPVAWPNQAPEPSYTWNNTLDGSTSDLISESPHVVEGRDFFNEVQMPGYIAFTYPFPLDSNGFPNPSGGSGGGDTQAPTISITSPANNATVSSTISVQATASDNVGVTEVQFLLDGSVIATDLASPYTWSWNTASSTNGSHTLSAKAYDAAGNVGTATNVGITVANTSGTETSTPSIASFSANPGTITQGQASTLSWVVSGNPTPTIGITPNIGQVSGSSVSVTPNETTAYTLTAQNNLGIATAQTTVTVETSGGGGGGGYSGGGTGSGSSSGSGSGSSSDSSPSALQALLQSLLAELESLINELNTQLVASFTRNLTIGNSGADAKNLQIFLNDNGYTVSLSGAGSLGHESTYFGAKTQEALAKWQKANHLPATGFFGGLTRGEMEKLY